MANPEVKIRLALDGAGQVTSGVNSAAASLDKLSQSGAKAGQQAQLTGQQMAQVSAQLQDLFVQIQGGAAPMTALLQQGSQLSGVFGGTGNALRALASLVTPTAAALGALAGVVGAVAYGYAAGSAEAQQFGKAIALTGNAAGVTVNQLAAMAARMETLSITQGKAAESLVTFINAGFRGTEGLERFTSAAIRLENVGGRAVEETAKAFADLGKDPLQASIRLNESTNFLTASIYQQIRALEQQGDAVQAAKVAQDAYAQAIEAAVPQIETQLGLIERKWRDIRDGAKQAIDALKDIGRPETLQDRREGAVRAINVAQSKILDIRSGQQLPGVDYERVVAAQQRIIDQNKVLLQDIEERERRERRVAEAKRLQAAQTQFEIEADRILSGLADKRTKQAEEERRVRTALVAAGKDEKTIAEALAQVREKYRDKGADGAAERELEARKKLIAELAGLTGDFAQEWDRLNAMFKSGDIRTIEDLEAAQRRLLERQPAIRENYRQEMDAAKEAAKARADARRAEDAAIEQELNRRRNEEQQVTRGLRDRITALSDENAAAALAREQQISLSEAVSLVTIKRLEDRAAMLEAGSEAEQAVRREIELRQQLSKQVGLKELNDFLDPTKAQDFGAALSKAFDGAGNSLVKLVNLLNDANIKQADMARKFSIVNKLDEGPEKTAKLAELQARAQRNSIELYAGMAGAAKTFFNEGTRGYKALEAAETAFRVYQLASDLQKGISAAAVGVANQAQGDPYTAVPRMAAMAAIMAGLGFAIGGIGGGSSSGGDGSKVATGTGTVFGDSSAKSESLGRSIETLADTADLQLRTQTGMLDALRSIEAQIGGVTNQVLRAGAAGDVGQRLGIQTGTTGPNLLGRGATGGILNLDELLFGGKITNALFGKTTKITGSGLFAGAQDLGSILSEGLRLQDFADTNSTRKFLGLKVSSSNSTSYRDADPTLQRQFGQIFKDFAGAITLAAGPLDQSLSEVTGRLNSFVVDIGKIDLQGLSGEQIQEKLSAVLGAAADGLAEAAIPGLQDFQRVGEGYFETTVRVAAGVELAGEALDLLGITAIGFGQVARKQGDVAAEIVRQSITAFESLDGTISGVGDLIATLGGSAEDLADTYRELIDVRATLQGIGISGDALTASMVRGAGGLDALADSVGNFFDAFLSDEEKLAAKRARLQADAARIGIDTLPQDREGFKQLVLGIDDTTEAGQRFLAQVLGLSEAFDDVASAAEALTEKLAEEERKRVEKAAEGQRRLMQLIDANIGKFLSPADNLTLGYERVAGNLSRGAGLDFTVDQLRGASLTTVAEFAQAFLSLEGTTIDARIAVVEAAGALADLASQAANLKRQSIEAQIKAITDEYGDVRGALEGTAETLADRFRRSSQELKDLERGLDELINGAAKSVQEVLADMLSSRRALQEYRTGSLADAIEQARMASLDPQARIAAMRATEAALFGQLGTAADPVAIAQRLQAVVLGRIREEARLRDQDAQTAADLARKARETQIDTLRQQIDGAQRLRDLAKDIAQTTADLRFSDLSPLSFEDQLGAAKSLFERTLADARAGDAFAQGQLTGNARSYLEEARDFFASSGKFADIFNQVTGALDSFAATAPTDPQLVAMQQQLAALESLQETQVEAQNTAAAELAALLSIDSALAGRSATMDAAIDRQTEAAREQIEELRKVVAEQRAQVVQQAEAVKRLEDQLKELNATSTSHLQLARLEAERPTERTV